MSQRQKHSKTLPPAGRPAGYVTYAVFHLWEKDSPGMRAELVEVKNRSLAALDLPPEAHEFYFCDAPAHKDSRDPLAQECNLSGYYAIAREIITSEELIARLTAKDVIQKDPPPKGRRDKEGNLLAEDVRHSIWRHKANSTPYHAVAPNGLITELNQHFRHTVIDPSKNIMMAWGDAAPRQLQASAPREHNDAPRPKPPQKTFNFKP